MIPRTLWLIILLVFPTYGCSRSPTGMAAVSSDAVSAESGGDVPADVPPADTAPSDAASPAEGGGLRTEERPAVRVDDGEAPELPKKGVLKKGDGADVSPVSSPVSECEKMVEELKSLRKEIPFFFIDLQRTVREIDHDVRRAIRLAERFLEVCKDSSELPWVKAYLARDFLTRDGQFFNETKTKLPLAETDEILEMRAEYRRRIEKLAKEARDASAPKSQARAIALGALADVAFFNSDYAVARKYSKELLKVFPDDPNRSKFVSDVGKSYFSERKYEEAVVYLTDAVAKYRDDPHVVVYHSLLVDALHAAGDMEGMQDVCTDVREGYRSRMEITKSPHLRGGYEQWWLMSGFWIGFACYALGDVEGARDAWNDAKELIESYEFELKQQEKELPNVVRIVKQFRIDDHLLFQKYFQGLEPTIDFDDIEWVTKARPMLRDLRGKVVVVLFRQPDNKRVAGLLQDLDGMVKENSDVVGITLGFYSPRISDVRRYEKQQKMFEDLASLGVDDLPAGFDGTAGPPKQSIFRKLHATVGTPTLIVFDRRGRFAWYRVDPHDFDRAVLKRVVDRLLNEKIK